MQSPLLLEVIYLLLASVILVPICQTIKLGAVPGFLIAGIIIGPHGLGLITNVEHIAHISEFGVVLLLFLIGMEMKPAFLWRIKSLVFGLGSLQILSSATILILLSHFMFALSWPAAIIIGLALSLSSTAFVLQILTQKKSLNTDLGKSSVAILLMQDLAVVPLLALIPLLSEQNSASQSLGFAVLQSLLILTVIIIIGRYLLNPILHKVAKSATPEIFTTTAVLIVLGTAYLTEHAGLSMAMGAFLAGLLISESVFRHQIRAEIQPFRGLLLGAFFVAMGMSLNIALFLQMPVFILSLVCLVVLVKVICLMPLVKLFGRKWSQSAAVALLLGQSGEFALVLFTLAFGANILSEYQFNIVMLITLFSMLITPLLAFAAFKYNARQSHIKLEKEELPQSDIVIAGFGRVGRTVGRLLTSAEIPYVALDNCADIVKKHKDTHPVYFGDVTQTTLLHSAGIKQARLAIVTVNEHHVAKELVESLRLAYPALTIIARGHNSDACQELILAGANRVISENLEASIELSEIALLLSNVDKVSAELLLSTFRENYYNKIQDPTDNN
jgi:monovalent cation:proton antiporter-2 (CPA2) family protein